MILLRRNFDYILSVAGDILDILDNDLSRGFNTILLTHDSCSIVSIMKAYYNLFVHASGLVWLG